MLKKKSWSELSGKQRVGVMLLTIIQFGLLGSALFDIWKRRDDEIRGSKGMWRGIVFINYVGPIAYFLLGRKG